MPQLRAHFRRGAPRPAADLHPPAHLSADAKRAFAEAVASRPGFFTPADSRLLSAYAIACTEVRRMEIDRSVAATVTSYTRAVELMLKLARNLRLSPIARAEADQSAAPPLFDVPTLRGDPAPAIPPPWRAHATTTDSDTSGFDS
ncbi:hypothetical protein [Roseomonas rosulenta]|uniref:hypothetical protein n=1 Tax=Roseomonas rosulenta TaxID=2748667 RepID=UPI0018DFBE9B|nr:hypothetical protein [Roseomonas rosulenta]